VNKNLLKIKITTNFIVADKIIILIGINIFGFLKKKIVLIKLGIYIFFSFFKNKIS